MKVNNKSAFLSESTRILAYLWDKQKPRLERIEAEIRQEKAESLGRAGERLENTLGELRLLRERLLWIAEDRLHTVPTGQAIPAEIREGLAKHARLWGAAQDLRYQLIVQREALGFRRHEEVDRQYPSPSPLTLAVLRREMPR